MKEFWGIDDGLVIGARRFDGHVGAVMVVYLAFLTLLARNARYERICVKRSRSPLARALREQSQVERRPGLEVAGASLSWRWADNED